MPIGIIGLCDNGAKDPRGTRDNGASAIRTLRGPRATLFARCRAIAYL
jgi:hypothetical protein